MEIISEVNYKGGGEHSVSELEFIVEQQQKKLDSFNKDIDKWDVFEKYYKSKKSNSHSKHWNFMEGIKSCIKSIKPQ